MKLKIKISAAQKAQLIVDELGKLHAKMGPLLLRDKAFKDELASLCRNQNRAFDGLKYRASVNFTEPSGFDIVKAKTFLTLAQIKKCIKKLSRRHTVKVVSLRAAGGKS